MSTAAATAPRTLPAVATTHSGPLADDIDKLLTDASRRGFNGAVLIERDGKIVLAKGYGWLDREAGRRSGVDGVYPIGSVTKQFTAAAVLKLVEMGKLKLDDPLTKHLDGIPADKREITFHQLLTHTAGMPERQGDCDDEPTRDIFIDRTLKIPLESKPGAAYLYSNSGYNLLAALVERISGRPYEEFLRSEILAPAGMTETGLYLPKWPLARMAIGYRESTRWGRFVERFYKQADWPPARRSGRAWCGRGAGSLHSTLADMYRWHRALFGSKVLPPELLRTYMTAHVDEDPGPATSWYGYGWVVDDRKGKKTVTHNGGVNDIFFADFYRFVDQNSAVLIVSNSFFEREGALELSPKITQLVRQELQTAAPKPRLKKRRSP